eukprot:TRINITY_DN6914_c0_g1_i1.p1 TRINITY_DN6914_c0_g1~~TRINITY_DN6914_c0_g1_i1.p1  ORF type:complete len:304 (+),score=36.78 TRINITY_DN6914_c0_g1_i1:35-946(+)
MTVAEQALEVMGMLVLSLGTLLLGCWRTKNETADEKKLPTSDFDFFDSQSAIIFPCFASLLLLLIYFFEITFWVVIVAYCCLAVAAAHFVAEPLQHDMGWFVSCTSLSLIALWIITGNWLAHNTLTVLVSVLCMCSIKAPNAKVFTILLIGLTCYDVFWVFLSPYFFGDSVMESVATRQQGYLSWPGTFLIPVTGGYSLLGAGDVVLPGIAIACLCRIDKELYEMGRMQRAHIYTISSLFGYLVGFLVCNMVLDITRTPQPALLYLTPGTLIPPLLLAYKRRELRGIWTGFAGELEEQSALLG